LAGALSLFMISLAGIPLTGGFIGKFYLFSAAIQKGYVGLAIIGVLNSVISVFYYFRLMVMMYMKDPQEGQPALDPVSVPVVAVIALGVLGVIWLGVYPSHILNLAAYSSLALK
jgi:NADH-quinone oxidoreductase subunit N